jgi:hypothetical protein
VPKDLRVAYHCANLTEFSKHKKFCLHLGCPHYPFEHDYENVEIRRTLKKTKKILLDLKAKFESSSSEKMTNGRLLADCLENLEIVKAKMFCLLDQVGENVRSLESTALRSNTLSPAMARTRGKSSGLGSSNNKSGNELNNAVSSDQSSSDVTSVGMINNSINQPDLLGDIVNKTTSNGSGGGNNSNG